MTAIEQRAAAARPARSRGRLPVSLAEARRSPEQLVFALPVSAGVVGMAVALVTVFVNETDAAMAPLLALLAVAVAVAVAVRRVRTRELDRPALLLAVAALAAAGVVALLPTWMYGYDINGIVHRTVVSGPLLLILSVVIAVLSVRRLFAASPSGQDLSLVPIVAVPL
ncbi:MAG TPA: hypothetical protein VIH37_00670, partial [Candidatus Limnocylindrales bacterium]